MANRDTDFDASELTEEESADYKRIEEEAFAEALSGDQPDTSEAIQQSDSVAGDDDKRESGSDDPNNADFNEDDDQAGDDDKADKSDDDQHAEKGQGDGEGNDKSDDDETPDIKELHGTINKLLDKVNRMDQQQQKNDGSIGGMRQKVDSIMDKLQENRDTKGDDSDGPSRAQVTAALKDSEKFKQLSEDFPEISEALLEMAETLGGGRSGSLDVDKLKSDLKSELSSDERFDTVYAELQELKLNNYDENWQEKIDSDDFKSWALSQLEEHGEGSNFAKLVKSPKAEDAITLMKKFDEHSASQQSGEDGRDDNPDDQNQNSQNKSSKKESRLRRAMQRSTGRSQGAPPAKSEDEYLEEGYNEVRGR